MSALAIILADKGYSVTGSDQTISNSFDKLISKGITVFKTQNAVNISTICSNNIKPLVVISTAIPQTNPELRAARNRKLEILHRSDVLALLIKNQPSIVVSGTHGKTTTSTFIATLLSLTKQDPTAIVGGLMPVYKSNAYTGKGKLLIAEADESDGTIIKFKPYIGLINNIELDHTNHYKNMNLLIKTMKKFCNNSKNILANYDCKVLRDNLKDKIWWSTKTTKGIEFAAIPYSITGQGTKASFYEKGNLIGEIELPLPGLHNLSNLTGAISACRLAGIPFNKLNECLRHLKMPLRRFEFRGIWNNRQIVDDYAHHPSEIKATLSIARLMISTKKSTLPKIPLRIVSIFQPHRFSRTRDFLKEFGNSLKLSDLVILAPIYHAGEAEINGISSETLGNYIKETAPNLPTFVAKDFHHLITLIQSKTVEGDLILNMGAGDINNLWSELISIENYLEYPSIKQIA